MKIILLSAIILSCFFCFSCKKTNENSVENPIVKAEKNETTVTKTEKQKTGKGFLLSAEQKDNEWVFRLEPNYNRIVTEEEILKATGIENVKKMIETISENDTVNLMPNKEGKYPPSEILKEISEHCKKLKINTKHF